MCTRADADCRTWAHPVRIIIADGTLAECRAALPGTVVGLIDERGFCLGIGLLAGCQRDRVVSRPPRRGAAGTSLRVDPLRLDGYRELAPAFRRALAAGNLIAPTGQPPAA